MAFPFNEKTHTNHRKLLPQVLTLTWRSTWQTWCRRLVRWFGSWYIVILVFGKVRIIAYLTMVEMVTELVVFFGSRWWFKFISWRLHFFLWSWFLLLSGSWVSCEIHSFCFLSWSAAALEFPCSESVNCGPVHCGGFRVDGNFHVATSLLFHPRERLRLIPPDFFSRRSLGSTTPGRFPRMPVVFLSEASFKGGFAVA